MKNLKIGKKLLITFGVIIILLLTTIIMSVSGFISISKDFTNFYNKPYNITNKTMDMQRIIQSAVKNIGYTMMATDSKEKLEFAEQANEDMNNLEKDIDFLRENFTGDVELINNFEKIMVDTKELRNEIINLAKNNKNNEASYIYFKEYHPALLDAQNYLKNINSDAVYYADMTYKNSMNSASIEVYSLVFLSILALVITGILSFYITRSLTKPILEIEKAANNMTNGNLNVNISYVSKDELGNLSNSMRSMTNMIKEIINDMSYGLTELSNGNFTVDSKVQEYYKGDFQPLFESIQKIILNLTHTISEINQSSEQVAVGSDQVSSSSMSLSQGATEQASSVEELSATIHEISEHINQNAQNATIAKEQTKQAGIEIAASSKQMEKMIEAMNDISENSTKIQNIIKTIDNIAFQTNILALNAAVEAARAGTAGKGFAVVADEVRNLASKSAEAAKDTSTLIGESIVSVENGVKLAGETAKAILDIVNGANLVSSLVENITEASIEQADAIKQITLGVEQISSVIQTNSATAEESAAASEELNGQALVLKSLVHKFKIKNISDLN